MTWGYARIQRGLQRRGQNGPGPMHEVGPGSLIPSDPPLVRLKESFYNRGSVKGVSRKGGGGGRNGVGSPE